MAAYRIDAFANVVVPAQVTVANAASLQPVFDPAITGMLAHFKAVLNDKLDAAWANAARGFSTHVVADTYAYEPTSPAANLTWTWPALFMWRITDRMFERTQVRDCSECTGKISYILPPLSYADVLRLAPIRTAVRAVLHEFIEQHGDPGYSNGVNLLGTYTISDFTWGTATYGLLPSTSGLEMMHPTLEIDFKMAERQEWVTTQYSNLTEICSTLEAKPEDAYTTGNDIVLTTYDADA